SPFQTTVIGSRRGSSPPRLQGDRNSDADRVWRERALQVLVTPAGRRQHGKVRAGVAPGDDEAFAVGRLLGLQGGLQLAPENELGALVVCRPAVDDGQAVKPVLDEGTGQVIDFDAADGHWSLHAGPRYRSGMRWRHCSHLVAAADGG